MRSKKWQIRKTENMAKENIFKRWPWLAHVLAMVGISVVVLVLVFTFIKIYARQGQEYELPDVVGINIAELENDNPIDLDIVVLDSIYRPGQEGGRILTQDPKAGTMVKKGRKLYITMTAYSPEDAVLPELAGLTVRQAVSELTSVGLEVGQLKFVEDRYKNSVIDQSCKGKTVYAGQQIPRGSVIDLIVGLGDSTGRSVVPFVIGKTSDKARRDILSASLNVGKEHFKGVKHKETAVVYKQEPDYNGVDKYPFGTTIELWYKNATDAEKKSMIDDFRIDSSRIISQPEFQDIPDIEDLLDDEVW